MTLSWPRALVLVVLAAGAVHHPGLHADGDGASAALESVAGSGQPPADSPHDLGVGAPNVQVLSHGPGDQPDTNAVPPDASGDVGPTQYLLAVNGRIRTYAKTTGTADDALNATTDAFFLSVRDGAATGKPRVRYDRRAGRWIVTMITAAVPNRFLVAVSDSSTISGTTDWRRFQWTNTRTQGGVGGAAACVGDDPTLAVDEHAVYVGVNQKCGADMFSLAFDSTSLYVIRRSALYTSGSPAILTPAMFTLVDSPTSAGIYAPQGVQNYDAGAVFGYVIGVDNLAKGRLVMRRVSNPGSASPTISASDIAITNQVENTGNPIDVPHLGGALPLDGLDHRLGPAVIRNGRLWASHHFEVNAFGDAQVGGGRNGIRWYELSALNVTPTLVQWGTVRDAAGASPSSYWNGSLMVNGQGHMALGMSNAGAARRVNAAVASRLAGDPLRTMGTPVLLTNSVASYNLQSTPPVQAWGRTSATSVDPDDDMTMWTLQQFVDGANSYGLQLTKLVAPPPASIASVSPSTLPNNRTNATVTVTGTATDGAGFFDPGTGFLRRLTAAFSGGGVIVTNVVVNSPTSLTLTANTVGAAPGVRSLTIVNPDGQTTQLASALTISLGTNDPPVAVNDSGSTPFNTPFSVPAPGVLANDSDPEGQPLTAQVVATVTHGSLAFNANGSFVYTPSLGYSGVDTFTYRASDGTNQSNVATVTITVGANRGPVFGTVPGNQTLYVGGAIASTGPLPFTVADPDGNQVMVTATSSNQAVVPAAGLTLAGSGASRSITVRTPVTATGSSTITLTASDGASTAVHSFVVTVLASAVPSPPQNLVATVTRNTVVFTWQPPVSSTGEPVQTYVLDAGPAPGVTALSLPLGNVLAFSATVPDAFYYVRLRAVTPAGSSQASNEVSIALGQVTPPLAPQALLATVQGTLVSLRWTENPLGPAIAGYQLQAGSAPGLADIAVIGLSPAARTLSVNAPAGTYYVRVVAVNAAGVSPPSNEAVVAPGPGACTIPAVPTGVVATATPGRIVVSWNPPASGAIPATYVLQAGSTSGAANIGVVPLAGTSTGIAANVPPGPYFIRIAAANACGSSAVSAEASAVVP